jgi:hypothetical protein
LKRSAILVTLIVAVTGCSTLKQLSDTVATLQQLQFKLDGVKPGTLAGVDLTKANDPSRLSATDGLRLATAYAEGSWPLSFTLNVAARNPNDDGEGSGGGTALLSSLAWTLAIDGKETISGDIPEPLQIPGAGRVTIIPFKMSLDLYRFFGDGGYDDLLNLALAIAGAEGTASRLTLTAVPTVSIAGVPVRYPGAIKIVDTRFSGG